ncbi:hypothetical protein CMUS01_10661 [Colletotrichum musicola]|uniref:Uncharacterized protein n=1 Tax=Colletotrichum musicola TaxID=2175873 RepID=A0A8H6N8E1_9PEZI|nr:hypothetical protein CMUS01_10661 [Colletotrichum musicola]
MNWVKEGNTPISRKRKPKPWRTSTPEGVRPLRVGYGEPQGTGGRHWTDGSSTWTTSQSISHGGAVETKGLGGIGAQHATGPGLWLAESSEALSTSTGGGPAHGLSLGRYGRPGWMDPGSNTKTAVGLALPGACTRSSHVVNPQRFKLNTPVDAMPCPGGRPGEQQSKRWGGAARRLTFNSYQLIYLRRIASWTILVEARD